MCGVVGGYLYAVDDAVTTFTAQLPARSAGDATEIR
jgi:hypothetical protein